MKRASWARFAQLSAVALALVLVLGAGGYGITRGLMSSSTSPCDPHTEGFNIIQVEGTALSHLGGPSGHLFRQVGYEWPPVEPRSLSGEIYADDDVSLYEQALCQQ